MSVILTVAKNGGGAASGAILGVEGDSFQLSASSKAGWTAASARWEIYDFPAGFAQPAGWSTDGTTGAYYYATANDDPPAFTVPQPYWGKFMLSLTATESSVTTTDTNTAIDIRSASGHSNIGRSEGAVFGGEQKRWVGELQRFIKSVGDRIAGAESAIGGQAFFPTGVAGDDTDAIETLLNAGALVVLYGTLFLDRPVIVTTGGGGIVGSPELGAKICQDSTWSGTGVSDPDNALFRLQETEGAEAATTPNAAKTTMFSDSVPVTSATGFTIGRYFKTLGISGANDYYEQSAGAGCPTEELLQVDSESGGTVTHRIPQRRHIGQNNASAPHKTLKLLDDCVDGFRVERVTFDVYQNGDDAPTLPVVACAVSATFARNITIADCKFKGFVGHSGAGAIYMRGCRDFRVDRCRNIGATNSRIYLFSCQNGAVEMDDVLDVRERANTRGGQHERFYAWTWRSQCHNITLKGTIRCAHAAVQAWGGDNCELDVDASDIRFQTIGAHAVGIPDDTGGRRGYILDTGANDVPTAEFGRHNRYRVRWSDAHTGTAKYWGGGSDVIQHWHAAIYQHDVWQGHWAVFSSDLSSDPATATSYRWLGLVSQDVSGSTHAVLKGFVKGAAFIGTINDLVVDRLWHKSGAGSGNTGYNIQGTEAGILLDEGSGGLPYFRDVLHEGYHLVEFYSLFAFPSSGYKRVLIERCVRNALLYDNTFEARDVVIGRCPNSSSFPGPMLALPVDEASATDATRRVSVTPAAAPADGVFISMSINTAQSGTLRPVIGVMGGPTAVAPIYVAGATTIKARQFVESNGSGYAIAAANGADHLATLARIIGRARYTRANAGGTATMQLG